MSTLITGATSWLATYLIQSTLLLLGALVLVRWLRDPAARERVWKIALTAPLLTASLGWLLPAGARPVLDLSPVLRAGIVPPAEPAPPQAGAQGSAVSMTTLVVNPSAPPTSSVPATPTREETARAVVVTPPRNGLAIAAVTLWAAGAAFLLLRRAVALRRLNARLASRRTVRQGVAHDLLAELCSDDELSVRPRLTLADELSTPLVLGLGEICLPRRVAEELPERELAAILAHEVAHVRRGDLLWLRGCALLECVLFAQPLNRLARQRLLADAEMLCDDWAGERTGARLELAQGLETVARWSRVAARPLPLPCLGGDRSALLQRVERLLAEPEARRRTVAVTAMLGAVVVALACVGPTVTTSGGDGAPDFEALDTDALIVVSKQVSARASERRMALPEDWKQRYAEPLSVPGTKAVRILRRDGNEVDHEIPPKRGGGGYYSFALDDHDYNREPDLEYSDDSLSTGFYGRSTGHVLNLGSISLSEVGSEKPPEGLDPEVSRLYATMTSFEATDDDPFSAFGAVIGPTFRLGSGAVQGDSYLLRAILPGEHDLLAAFTLVEVSHDSVVLVGRVLKAWPIRGERRETGPRVDWSTADAPPWLLAMDVTSLYALQRSLQEELGARLLAVPATAGGDGASKDAGIARLLQRGRYEGLTRVRGHGAYFSFVTRSNSYDDEPDLEWQQDEFNTGFAGSNTGAFVDLGDVPLAYVDPAQLSSPLAPVSPSPMGSRTSAASIQIKPNHTYALRSVLAEEHDVLAAFRPVHQDEYGMTIAWRVLHRYDG